ncbi:hypothetical protein RB195_007675 [Necator americanus]|uniref:Uncharacterized protein n=1 Tax=Necator americanus TaxID=51031 RepID=A0ABR1C0S4_NECAM
MEGKSILSGLLLGWFFVVWCCTCLIDVSVPITSVPSYRLRDSIQSSIFYCPFTLDVESHWRNGPKEEVIIKGGPGTMFLFREKIVAVFENAKETGAVIQWFLGQVRLDHLFFDVLSFEYVWLTLLCVSVVSVLVQILVLEPFMKVKHAPAGYVQEMERRETEYANSMMRKFVVEKLLMLAYVVVRNTEKENNPVSSPPLSKSKRPGLFDWSLRVTDASVFAIWFIIVWSVTSVTTMANQRFETIIGVDIEKHDSDEDSDEEETAKKKKRKERNVEKTSSKKSDTDPNHSQMLMRRLLLLLSACMFTSTALISFGVTTFKLMHPIYSSMICIEGMIVLVRSIYVGYRIAWWQMVPQAKTRQSEAFQRRIYMSKRITDVILHSLTSVMYTLYLITGVIINGKLIPLAFVARLSHNLHRTLYNIFDHLNGLETSKFLD